MTPDNPDDLPELSLADLDIENAPDAVPLVADSALRDILHSLGKAATDQDCLRECALTLHQWTSADAASLYLLGADRRRLLQIHSVGFPRSLTEASRELPLEGTLLGLSVSLRDLVFSQQLDRDDRIDPARAAGLMREGIQTLMCAPLITRDQVIGAISLGWRRRLHLAESDRDLLMSLTYGIAIAVDRAGRM